MQRFGNRVVVFSYVVILLLKECSRKSLRRNNYIIIMHTDCLIQYIVVLDVEHSRTVHY